MVARRHIGTVLGSVALTMIVLFTVGCATPEMMRLESSVSADDAYRSYNELVESFSRIPTMRESNPYCIPLGKGIRAEWAGNYRTAEEAFRDGLANPAYWQTEYAIGAKDYYFPLFHAYIGHALYKQGKMQEALKEFQSAEPAFPRLMSKIEHDSYERGQKLFYAYLYKTYGKVLEHTGEKEQALTMYQKALDLGASEVNIDMARLKTAAESQAVAMNEAMRRAEEAERNGQLREAFQHYTAALSQSVEASDGKRIDFALIEKSIVLARKLEPPPTLSEEARRQAVFAATAVREAKDERGYDQAIKEYVNAISLAPWWADLYVNAALVCEQRGRYGEACSMLKLYQFAAPEAKDAEKIKTKMYELEYKARQGQKP
jgi:tetratricopeptide (TPR) repeat protein